MKPAPFTYLDPPSLDEVLAALAEHGDDAAVISGGQSLLPLMNLRLARPEVVVDPRRVPGLRDITVTPEAVVIGAMTTATEVLEHPEVGRTLPALVEAIACIGHSQIRNRTTIGGSVAHADPSSELPTVLAGVEGEVVLRSATGERRVSAAAFFDGSFSTTRRADELVTEVRFPVPPGATAWDEVARRPGDFALAGPVRLADRGGRAGPPGAAGLQRPGRPTGPRRRRRGGAARPVPRRRRPRRRAWRPCSPRSPPPTTATPRAATGRRSPPPSCAGCSPGSPPDPDPPPPEAEPHAVTEHPEPTRTVTIRVDGTDRSLGVEGRTLLSDALRHGAGLTGTHVACEQGACGACTVVLDGRAVRSCLVLAVQADGAEVATIEGVAPAGALHAVQEALRTNHGLQCGFCTPGIVMSLVAATHDGVSVDDAVDEVLGGHLCRCTGYVNIRAAIVDAWSTLEPTDPTAEVGA